MVHHRIQKKRRNKLKSVDPFNKNAAALREAKLKGKNLDVVNDEQRLPRRLLEIQQLSKRYEEEVRRPNNKRRRNRIFEESLRAGFKRRNFEDDKQLVNRVCAVTTEEVKEKRMLAKYELAGRDMRELEAEYKKMDEEVQQRRKRKVAQHEAKNGTMRSANSKRNQDKKLHESGTSACAEIGVKRKMSRKERHRELKRARRADEHSEMILNAKEVIPFGSRVDAPPQFGPLQHRQLDPIFAKAGSKALLLKLKLQAKSDDGGIGDAKKRSDELAAERSRVIEAYRMLKKNKAS